MLLLAAASSLATACAPLTLLPPAPPPRETPAVRGDLGPVPPGDQRVILDTPGEQARVSEVTGHRQTITPRGGVIDSAHERPVCLTPCVVDLRLGLHELSFQSTTNDMRGSEVEVEVQGDPLVVRHTMAEMRTPHPVAKGLGTAGLILGVAGLGGSIPLTAAGVVVRNNDTPHQSFVDGVEKTTETPGSKGLETAAFVTIGVSAALIVLGAIATYFGRDEFTPSATTEWALPGTAGPQASSAPPRAPNTLLTF